MQFERWRLRLREVSEWPRLGATALGNERQQLGLRNSVAYWHDAQGIPRELSLQRHVEGSTKRLSYRGRPKLVNQIIVALEQRLHNLSEGSGADIGVALSHFFAMLCKLENAALLAQKTSDRSQDEMVGVAGVDLRIDCLEDLPSHTWHLLAYYLRELDEKQPHGIFGPCRDIIDTARQIAGLVPLIDHKLPYNKGEVLSHSDIDLEAIYWLNRICIMEIVRVSNLPLVKHFKDQEFEIGRDPGSDWSSTADGCRQMVGNKAWARMLGAPTDTVEYEYGFSPSNPKVDMRRKSSGIAGQNRGQYMAELFPDKSEALASWILVANRTGWIDALSEFNLDKPWAKELLPTSGGGRPKSRFLIAAIRPKTGGFLSYVSSSGTYSPYRVLTLAAERSKLTRQMCRRKADILRNSSDGTNDDVTREIHKLDGIARSPFAYIPRSRSALPTSIFSEQMTSYSGALQMLVDRSGSVLLKKLNDIERKDLVERIVGLKLSDLRDAAGDRLWNKTRSLYALQEFLGHSHISTTAAYQAREQKRREAFVSYSAIMGTVSDEVANGRGINPAVIYARTVVASGGELPDSIRSRLVSNGLQKTRVGLRCVDPQNPPKIHGEDPQVGRCMLELCAICKNGVIMTEMPGVFEALVIRYTAIMDRLVVMPIDFVWGSLEDYEKTVIEEVCAEYFPSRMHDFENVRRQFNFSWEYE